MTRYGRNPLTDLYEEYPICAQCGRPLPAEDDPCPLCSEISANRPLTVGEMATWWAAALATLLFLAAIAAFLAGGLAR